MTPDISTVLWEGYRRMVASKVPTQPGFYWAKWRIADDGTREGDEVTPCDDWEVMSVYDPGNDDGLFRVSVPGVERSQSLENFFWGPGPLEMPR